MIFFYSLYIYIYIGWHLNFRIERVEKNVKRERKIMGAYCNGDVSLPPSYDVASGEDPRFCKHVRDNVHGNIYLDSVFFINHSFFFSFFRILLCFSYKESEYANFFKKIFFFCFVIVRFCSSV